MTYKLAFEKKALKEWHKLGHPVQMQFKNKLAERLENPYVPSARLSGCNNRYKIKLKASGYRLIYDVIDDCVVLLVIAVAKRENNTVYLITDGR